MSAPQIAGIIEIGIVTIQDLTPMMLTPMMCDDVFYETINI